MVQKERNTRETMPQTPKSHFTISLIAAIGGEKRVIGKDGALPWRIKEDLEHFKETTMGHVVIMGRKTFQSIGKPLPKRINIVITRSIDFAHEGVIVAYSFEDALDKAYAQAKNKRELFVIGGAEIYKEALPYADKLYLTLINGDFEGDTFFPEIKGFGTVISEEAHNNGRHPFSFVEIERKK
jgi:dihydrofolate reductase